MRRELKILLLAVIGAGMLSGLRARAQDAPPSLGDVARQARLQKQKDAQLDKDSVQQAKDASATAAAQSKGSTTQSTITAAKDAAVKDNQPKSKHVITNEEIPEHVGPTSTRPNTGNTGNTTYQPTYYPQPANNGAADQWKQQILSVKSYISNMQAQISNLEQSIHYAGGECVSNCAQWNERQQQKQQQVDVMKQQVEQMQQRLEQMQETARRQGFGSSVYDP